MKSRPARKRAPSPPPNSWFSLNAPAGNAPSASPLLTQLAWVLAGGLAIALLYMVFGPHRIGDYFTETDFYGAYAEGARLIQHGHLIPSRYGVIGPGYEVTLALAGFVVRNLFLAAELISVAATVATLLLWFHLLKQRAGAALGLAAALFLVTNGTFFRYGYGALTDPLAIALQAAALYVLLARAGTRAALAAGLLSALAFLTRYNAVYLLPAGLVAILVGGTRFEGRGRAALLFTAGFFAPVVPWVLYSLAQGSGFSFQLHHNIAYEVYARSRGITWDDYQKTLQPQFKNLWDVIARDPGAVASRMLLNLGGHLRQDAAELLGWPVAVAAAIGAALGWRDGTLRRLWPVLAAGALLFLTLVPVFYSARYSLALLPVYASLAAIAVASPLGALAIGRRRRVWLKPLLAVVPLGLALMASVKVQARVIDQLPTEVLECGKTLARLKAPGDRVIARKFHIGYYGGVQAIGFPFADSLSGLARYARRNHARWLFFSWPEAESRPQFYYLLDTTAVVPGLTPREVTRPHPAVLYEIGPDFGRAPDWLSNDTLRTWHNLYAQMLIDGPQPALLTRMGRVAMAAGRLDDARRVLDMAVRGNPRNVETLNTLGNVLVLQHNPASARVLYQQALALSPGNVEAQVGLGWASLTEGKMEEAAKLWFPVISATRNPVTLERMRVVYERLGNREAAAKAAATLARLKQAP